MNAPRYVAAVLFLTAALTACGGGGGGGNPQGGSTIPPTSAPPSLNPEYTTNATGVVVADDSNGSVAAGQPIAGVTVKLMPWNTCGPTPAPSNITPENDGCATPLPSPQATTNAQGQFTLNGAPNGKYLLVIGSDSVATPPPGYAPSTCTGSGGATCPPQTPAPFTVTATVHDAVTLTGGTQPLKAPTLPQYAGVSYATWETNGDYRLAILDKTTEMPCYLGWQWARAQNNLPGASVDEWLAENTRAFIYATQQRDASAQSISGPYGMSFSGLPDCADDVVGGGFGTGVEAAPSPNAYAKDLRAIWVSGAGYPFLTPIGGSALVNIGAWEFMIDPRSQSTVTWP